MLPLVRQGWPLVQRRIILAARARGCTDLSIGSHLGVSREAVTRWAHLDDPNRMTIEQALGIAELADDPAVLAPIMECVGSHASPARDSLVVAVELHEQVADLTRAAREADADGVRDERERTAIGVRADRTRALIDEIVGRVN